MWKQCWEMTELQQAKGPECRLLKNGGECKCSSGPSPAAVIPQYWTCAEGAGSCGARTLHYHVIISMACSHSGDPLAEEFFHSWHCPGLWDRERLDSSLKTHSVSFTQQARYHTYQHRWVHSPDQDNDPSSYCSHIRARSYSIQGSCSHSFHSCYSCRSHCSSDSRSPGSSSVHSPDSNPGSDL